jgi:hypothetical protein
MISNTRRIAEAHSGELPAVVTEHFHLTRTSQVRFYLCLYLVIAALYLLGASGRIGLSDGVAMLNVSQSFVTNGTFRSEPCDPSYEDHLNHCVPGRDGHYYAGFGLVPSLLAAPAVLVGRLVSVPGHVRSSQIPQTLVSLFTALLAPLACVITAMWMVRLGYKTRTALAAACVLAFASPYLHFGVKGFYSEPYFTVFLLLAAYLLSGGESVRNLGLAGLAFGIACGCRINGLILFPAFILSIALRVRGRGWAWSRFFLNSVAFCSLFSVCIILIGWANYIRFGSPLKTGYHLAFPTIGALLSTPLSVGTPQLLVSGEVGLLTFAPWLIVAFICFPMFLRRNLPEAVLCATVFLFNFVFFAKYNSWHGGWVVGPRLLTPTLPFLTIPLFAGIADARALAGKGGAWAARNLVALRFLTAILVIGGFLIQLSGVIYPEDRYFALKEFYEQRTAKPWWSGSVPLAYFEFLKSMVNHTAQTESAESSSFHLTALATNQRLSYLAGRTDMSKDAFLSSGINPENVILPNLMFVKMRFLGVPRFAVGVYVFFLFALCCIGLIGLQRQARSLPLLPNPSPDSNTMSECSSVSWQPSPEGNVN